MGFWFCGSSGGPGGEERRGEELLFFCPSVTPEEFCFVHSSIGSSGNRREGRKYGIRE